MHELIKAESERASESLKVFVSDGLTGVGARDAIASKHRWRFSDC